MIDEFFIFRRGNVSNDICPVTPLRIFHTNHVRREHVVQYGIKSSAKLPPMKKPIKSHADTGSSKSSA